MNTVCDNVRGKYAFAQKGKQPFDIITIVLVCAVFIFFFAFIFSLQAEGQQRFCSGQGYNYVAHISPNRVCINETLAYIEIKCSGFLNLNCEVLSEEKQFKQQEDFSDYNISYN